jgi:hypothetical protein
MKNTKIIVEESDSEDEREYEREQRENIINIIKNSRDKKPKATFDLRPPPIVRQSVVRSRYPVLKTPKVSDDNN